MIQESVRVRVRVREYRTAPRHLSTHVTHVQVHGGGGILLRMT